MHLAHGCIVGVYHFARASKNGWLAEARFFLSLTKKYKGKVFYVLDWEERAAAHKVEWAESWLDYVAKETGSTPIFYSYESLINSANYSSIAKYPLWVAKYRDYNPDKNFDMSSAGSAPRVKWWSSYIGWQWTSVGRLDGYNGNLDCTAFYVDEETLRKCIGGQAEQKAEQKATFKYSRSAIVSEAQPEPVKEEPAVDTAHTVEYYAKVNTRHDLLNVRLGPSTSYRQCSFSPIPKGAKVGVCKHKVGAWYLIKYRGKYGYVHSKYLLRI